MKLVVDLTYVHKLIVESALSKTGAETGGGVGGSCPYLPQTLGYPLSPLHFLQRKKKRKKGEE